MKPILLTAAGNPENQDRGLVLQDGSRVVLCVADGAGGRSGGAEAASMAVEFVRQNFAAIKNAESCAQILREMDAAIAKDQVAGETTCVLVVATETEIYGASVGDSGALWIPESGVQIELTRGQQRKPFIGSSGAWPASFHHQRQAGWLLLATDGLFKYTSVERIVATCREHPTELVAQQLIELVRYPSGALPDDVTVIVSGI